MTSATFGIVSAIQINLVSDKTSPYFWIGLGGVLFLYLLQVREVLAAIGPREWSIVPGGENGDTRYETIMEKFIASNGEPLSDDEYLNQLIADYVGSIDVNDSSRRTFFLDQFS